MALALTGRGTEPGLGRKKPGTPSCSSPLTGGVSNIQKMGQGGRLSWQTSHSCTHSDTLLRAPPPPHLHSKAKTILSLTPAKLPGPNCCLTQRLANEEKCRFDARKDPAAFFFFSLHLQTSTKRAHVVAMTVGMGH